MKNLAEDFEAAELLNELLLSLILDSERKIGSSFARICQRVTESLGFLVLIAPDEITGYENFFYGSSGTSEFFSRFRDLTSSRTGALNFETIDMFLQQYGVDIAAKKFYSVQEKKENSSIYFRPLFESDGRFIGLIAIQAIDDSKLMEGDILLSSLTSLINRSTIRLFAGVKFPQVIEVISGIAHDLRGGLALVGMQNELSRFQGSSSAELSLARERIAAGVVKAESASEQIQGFIELLFPPHYAASSCSPVMALHASVASLPWRKDSKSFIQTEIDPDVSNTRIEVPGTIAYWIFRSALSFFSDPKRMNKDRNQVKVKLFVDRETHKGVCLHFEMPFRDAQPNINKKSLQTFEKPEKSLTILSRAEAFQLWLELVGFKTHLVVENQTLNYEISFKPKS